MTLGSRVTCSMTEPAGRPAWDTCEPDTGAALSPSDGPWGRLVADGFWWHVCFGDTVLGLPQGSVFRSLGSVLFCDARRGDTVDAPGCETPRPGELLAAAVTASVGSLMPASHGGGWGDRPPRAT